MSDLPDRKLQLFATDGRLKDDGLKVLKAYRQGILRSRDEMDEQALLAAVQRGESPGKIADAAWGVTDD